MTFKLLIEMENGLETRIMQHGTIHPSMLESYRRYGVTPPFKDYEFDRHTYMKAPTLYWNRLDEYETRIQLRSGSTLSTSTSDQRREYARMYEAAQQVSEQFARRAIASEQQMIQRSRSQIIVDTQTEEPVDPVPTRQPAQPAPSRGFFNRLGRFISGDRND